MQDAVQSGFLNGISAFRLLLALAFLLTGLFPAYAAAQGAGAPPAQPAPKASAPAGAPTKAGDAVSAETRVEADDPMHVADRAEVIIEIQHPEGWTVEKPDPNTLNTGRYQVLDLQSEASAPKDGTVTHTLTLKTTLYRVGRFYLPPMKILLEDPDGQRRYVETEQVSVKVVSVVLDELEDAELRDVRGPARLFQPDTRWAWGGGIALASLFLLGVGFIIARRMKSRPKVEKEVFKPRRPAWEEAMERLEALQAADWPTDPAAVREFYFQLSETIREYLGRRYGFELLELTTSELIDRMKRFSLPPKVDRIGLENFLLDCDLVKFARYRASVEELAGAHGFALNLVEKTRPRPRPVKGASAAGDEGPKGPPPGGPPGGPGGRGREETDRSEDQEVKRAA